MNEEQLFNLLLIEEARALTDDQARALAEYRQTRVADVQAFTQILHNTRGLSFPSDEDISSSWDNIQHKFTEDRDERQETFPVRRSGFRVWVGIAAGLLLLCVAYFMLRPNATATYANGDQMSTEQLADGSVITINQHSATSVAGTYGVSERALNVQGDVYIDANKDELPMIVTSERFRIEVLGTRFSIMDYPNDNISSVTLYEGMITLTTPDGQELKMESGDHICWNQIDKSYIRSKASRNTPGWTTGDLTFDNVTWEEALVRIERQFDIAFKGKDQIALKDHFRHEQQDNNLSTLINRIERTTQTRIEQIAENEYRIRKQ